MQWKLTYLSNCPFLYKGYKKVMIPNISQCQILEKHSNEFSNGNPNFYCNCNFLRNAKIFQFSNYRYDPHVDFIGICVFMLKRSSKRGCVCGIEIYFLPIENRVAKKNVYDSAFVVDKLMKDEIVETNATSFGLKHSFYSIRNS